VNVLVYRDLIRSGALGGSRLTRENQGASQAPQETDAHCGGSFGVRRLITAFSFWTLDGGPQRKKGQSGARTPHSKEPWPCTRLAHGILLLRAGWPTRGESYAVGRALATEKPGRQAKTAPEI
jgi:hypothetical protein